MVPPVPGADAHDPNPAPTQFGARVYFGSPVPAYVFSFLLVSGAAAVTLALMGGGELRFPFVFFAVATVFAAWFGGVGPGLAVVPVGAIYAYLFFLYPPAPTNWLAFIALGPILAVGVAGLRSMHDRQRAIARDLLNFKLVGDHATDWILLLDEGLRIRYVNRRASTDLGWSERELLGREIESLVPEAQRPVLRAAVGSAKPAELIFERRDKSLVSMEIGCTSVETGRSRVIHVAARDVRERKEIARKLEELRHWESMRTLAGGLAHDFNNLLTTILGNASLARYTLPPSHESEPMLDSVMRSAQHSAELVQLMLATSGYKPIASEPLQLDELVDSALENRFLPPGVRIVKEATGTPVRGDRQTFETLLWSLVSNAAEAYGDQGGEVRVTIRLREAPVCERDSSRATFEEGEVGPGEYLGIVVEDQGAGMSKYVLEHAFDPFFTTKFAGRGLGLAAVRGIVRAYSGKLFLATTVGQGTRVEVWLPRDQLEMQPAAWDKLG